MASVEPDLRLVPSLLDRLEDQDSGSTPNPDHPRSTIRRLKEAIRRDLESLLNARNPFWDLAPEFEEARDSVLTYGLPDFSAYNVASQGDCDSLSAAIERAIVVFEPRLTDVKAAVASSSRLDRAVRIRVDARLGIDPIEALHFDIVVPLTTCACEIREAL